MQIFNGTPCMPWPGCRRTGYGLIRIAGVLKSAHRAVYENTVGPVPAGLTLDHLCRNRACVNPRHLEAVTNQVNAARGALSALRPVRKYCKRGHPFTGDNVITDRSGHRRCRTCRLSTMKAWRSQR